MRRFVLAAFLAPAALGAASVAPPVSIDWPAFMARQDMVWTHPPSGFGEAPFLGNGTIGALVHLAGQQLAWEVNRTDVTHDGVRYRMGRLVLQSPASGFDGGGARLDLWNGEVRGVLATDPGEIRWRTFAVQTPSVIVIELSGMRGQQGAGLVWLPDLARPIRGGPPPSAYPASDLAPPPDVTTCPNGELGVVTSVQSFVGSGAYAVALKRLSFTPDHRVYALAIGRGERGGIALAEAMDAVEEASARGLPALEAENRAWWHAYWTSSFLSLPDPRLESFYWIQMYRLGSAIRQQGPIDDNLGPWFRPGIRGGLAWDGGVQLEYGPLLEANRLAPAASLFAALDRGRPQLVANVAPPFRSDSAGIGRASDQNLAAPVNLATARSDVQRELGNLPWAAELYWEDAVYRGDYGELRNRVVPLLERTVALYVHYLRRGLDGRLHLPPTYSPETGSVADGNFDLALLRWGLVTLIQTEQRGQVSDPRLGAWKQTLAALPWFSTGRGGLLIGRGRPLTQSQPYYSHLFAIYPLHLLAPNRPAARRLVENSLANWERRPARLEAFSYAGAASLHAVLGEGAAAAHDLDIVLDRFVSPNTFSLRGDWGAVQEGPVAAAGALQELLLQSWGGWVRVFPAVPPAWRQAAFATLRAEGGFLVSAVRENGATAWVKVESPAAPRLCRIEVPGWSSAFVRAGGRPEGPVRSLGSGRFAVAIPQGGWVLLAPTAQGPLPPLAPVARPAGSDHPYPEHYRPASR